MATPPRTRYAQCGDIDIAYQVFGDGPRDLLVWTGASIPIDCVDLEPRMARFQRRLAAFGRVIRFDQRGVGLSGHMTSDHRLGTEGWVEDALAVLDAVGVERATLFAPSTASAVGIHFAAHYPERVAELIIVNGAARALWAEDYPIGVSPDFLKTFVEVGIRDDAIEQGFDGLALLAPSVSTDDAFRNWWDRSGNQAMTPSMARATSFAVAEGDVRADLPLVTAPTLIVHRVDNLFIGVEHGRYLAEHLPSAKYVELPGADNIYWVGDSAALLGEIDEFLTGHRSTTGIERALTTVLFTDIVGSTDRAARLGDVAWRDLLDSHDQMVRQELTRYQGREVNTAGDGFVATFTRPSGAIECAQSIVERMSAIGVEVRVGIHAGEVELRGQDVAGMAVHIGARVAALAGAGEILVSSTVREIVTGSGQAFLERGSHTLKGVPGTWTLWAVASATDGGTLVP